MAFRGKPTGSGHNSFRHGRVVKFVRVKLVKARPSVGKIWPRGDRGR